MRLGVIRNATAGSHRRDELWSRVRPLLEEAAAEVREWETSAQGDGARIAAALEPGDVDRLVVCGGDGTIADVVNGRADHTPLAIVPSGTANVLARELRLRIHNPRAIADTILHGAAIPMDVGVCNRRRFILMAGIGFDASTVRDVPPDVKQLAGAPAYVVSALKTLVQDPCPIRYRLRGPEGRLRATGLMLVIANTSGYGGPIRLAPRATVTDGRLDLCLFRERSRWAFVGQWIRVLAGLQLNDPHFVYRQVTSVQVRCSPPAAVQLDGDYFGVTPVDVAVEPAAVRIVAP